MIEVIVVLQAVEIPVVTHILAEMLQHKVELHRKPKCLAVQPESWIQHVVSVAIAFRSQVVPQTRRFFSQIRQLSRLFPHVFADCLVIPGKQSLRLEVALHYRL